MIWLFRPVVVEGDSMAPTYLAGDILLTLPLWGGVEQGECLVFREPESGSRVIKRVVGLPGQTPSTVHGTIRPGDGRKALATSTQVWGSIGDQSHRLLENQYFLLGDHSAESHDSRAYGPVDADALERRVVARIWPWHRSSADLSHFDTTPDSEQGGLVDSGGSSG